MERNANSTQMFQQFAEDRLKNHLAELNTRYENERLASQELKQRAYRDHQKIYEKELDEKMDSLLSHENNEWLKGELENLKHNYVGQLALNNK